MQRHTERSNRKYKPSHINGFQYAQGKLLNHVFVPTVAQYNGWFGVWFCQSHARKSVLSSLYHFHPPWRVKWALVHLLSHKIQKFMIIFDYYFFGRIHSIYNYETFVALVTHPIIFPLSHFTSSLSSKLTRWCPSRVQFSRAEFHFIGTSTIL